MDRHAGRYALVQFCPVAERLEFLNVGLVLMVPELNFVGVRMSKGQARVERAFGRQSKFELEAWKAAFASRLQLEFSRSADPDSVELFTRKRANALRLSPAMSLVVDDPKQALERLFLQLVGDEQPTPREPRIRRKLKEAFSKLGVSHYLDEPDPLELQEYGVRIDAPFGYQNGCYNLIDGMRLSPNTSDSLREAGKRAMEGNLLWKHFEQSAAQKRLIVVGDFKNQSNAFFNAVSDQMKQSQVRLHRLDDISPLVRDIEENGRLHA